MGDLQQIQRLINQYSFTLDAGDLDGFAALFENASWRFDTAEPCIGAQALFQRVLSRVVIYSDGTPRTRHMATNVEIEIDEQAGKARSQRYVLVYQQTEELPLQVIYSGHYFDEFLFDQGRWCFAKCEIRQPFIGNTRFHLKSE